MTYHNKLCKVIEDIKYDKNITTYEILSKIHKLMLDYGKYNAEKCLNDYKSTGTCMIDSYFTLNTFLETSISTNNKATQLKNYDKDLEFYENSFYCGNCGNGDKTLFIYSRTVANGEVWVCKFCKSECVTSNRPDEEDY